MMKLIEGQQARRKDEKRRREKERER